MTLTTLSPPHGLPVTMTQIKEHLRIDHDNDDDYLSELAQAATTYVEAYLSQNLINRTVRQYEDGFSDTRSVRLMALPFREVVSVTVYDENGMPQELNSEAYTVRRNAHINEVIFAKSVEFSATQNGIEIDYISGFGESGPDVPSNIIRALLVLIAHWYEFRGMVSAGDETAIIPKGIQTLLAPMRQVNL